MSREDETTGIVTWALVITSATFISFIELLFITLCLINVILYPILVVNVDVDVDGIISSKYRLRQRLRLRSRILVLY